MENDLWEDDETVKNNRAFYREKFELAEKILERDCLIPEGAFYLWLKVGNGEKFAKLLWKEKGIKVMPGAYLSNFNNSKPYIRIALVSDIKETKTALKGIYDILCRHYLEN